MRRESTVSSTRLHLPNNRENRRAAFAALSGFTKPRDHLGPDLAPRTQLENGTSKLLQIAQRLLALLQRTMLSVLCGVAPVYPHGTMGVGLRRSHGTPPPWGGGPWLLHTASDPPPHLHPAPGCESKPGGKLPAKEYRILFGGHPLKLERYRED